MINCITEMSKCTGCGACKNKCPVNAIEFKESENTFLYPEINEKCMECGACVTVCPVNNYKNDNQNSPIKYALQATDDIRINSSSGGCFYVFSKNVLEKNGVVFGAAFNENFLLSHIKVDNIADISKCQGSKYLQSYIGDSFRQVKEHLNNGQTVLFTGCPCQIAGLKNYLNKDYDSLILIDLLCHGVPSQKLFDKYLEEKRLPNDKITDVNFRSKKDIGWRADVIKIAYEKNINSLKSWASKDSFEVGFQENIILRDCCENCKFSAFPRVGDISIGDFWGMSNHMQNDGKGTSLVFVNNAKGIKFLKEISTDFKLVELLNFDTALIRNRIYANYPHHKNKALFFKHIKTKPFSKSIEMASNRIYDIAIVGIPTVENFGGAITYYALYKYLSLNNIAAVMIERPISALHPPTPLEQIFYKNYYDTEIISNMPNKNEMDKLNNISNIFLLGSDQMLHSNLYNNFEKFAVLDWVDDEKTKIAYAASFGHDTFTGTDIERKEIAYYLSKFDAFSVREESGKSLAKSDFYLNATLVCDPVFLVDKGIYAELANNSTKQYNGDYIGGYILDPNIHRERIVNSAEKTYKLPSMIYSEMFYNNTSIKEKWGKDIEIGKIEDRLNCIMNCKYFITDSFHGVCFAIIFQKNFFVILNTRRGTTRMHNILNLLGLNDRCFSETDNIDFDNFKPIDYESVMNHLSPFIDFSKDWLLEKINSAHLKPYSDRDIYNKKLQRIYEEFDKRIKFLYDNANLSFVLENNVYFYFEKLKNTKNQYTIIISAKDTPGMSIDNKLNDLLHSLGIQADLTKAHWCGFIYIFRNGIRIIEKCEYSSKVVYNSEYLNVISAPLKNGNMSSIKIFNEEYSLNLRGLNIVVYDELSRKIIDKVNFDTHDRRFPCIRK